MPSQVLRLMGDRTEPVQDSSWGDEQVLEGLQTSSCENSFLMAACIGCKSFQYQCRKKSYMDVAREGQGADHFFLETRINFRIYQKQESEKI